MTTAFFTHEAGLAHVTPDGHPERVARLQAIYDALRAPDFNALARRVAPMAEESEVLRCHPESHLARTNGFIAAPDLPAAKQSLALAKQYITKLSPSPEKTRAEEWATALQSRLDSLN